MKYLFQNRALSVLLIVLLGFVNAFEAVAQVPDAPNPPRLVNDFAGILSSEQTAMLEDTLVAFSRKTSNQIVIVIFDDLGGMPAWQMAREIGAKWGVGKKDKKGGNGLVILVKPKTADSRGEAFIASGYGLEGALPDAFCRRIVENEMIPQFKNNDYFKGIKAALQVIMPVAAGEYSEEQYNEDNELSTEEALGLLFFVIVFVLFLMYVLKDKGGNSGNNQGGRRGGYGGPFITFGPGFGGGLGSGSSYGGGGFSGGFGGFGGGGFGGGGAGGSW